jgi:hypothetical protein
MWDQEKIRNRREFPDPFNALAKKFESLPAEVRCALWLVAAEGISPKEIASTLGFTKDFTLWMLRLVFEGLEDLDPEFRRPEVLKAALRSLPVTGPHPHFQERIIAACRVLLHDEDPGVSSGDSSSDLADTLP